MAAILIVSVLDCCICRRYLIATARFTSTAFADLLDSIGRKFASGEEVSDWDCDRSRVPGSVHRLGLRSG